jgi:hypothetical protein
MLYSCYPGSSTSVEDYDLVATFFDENADFAGAKTFFVLDSIFHVTGDSTKPDSDLLTREFDRQIIDEVRNQLIARGYTELANPDSTNRPDLGIRIHATAIENYNVYSYYPGWWGGWYPGWGGGYYPWYPGYGGTYVTKYTVGSLIIEMSDVRRIEPAIGRVPTIWLAGLNGYLQNSSANNASRTLAGIRQAFNQSPYISSN